jgi:Tfp pilus assembly protein PilN
MPAPGTLPGWRRAIVFGTGLGIAIGERNLDVAIVRARPSGPVILAAATIADFRARPAAEWGGEVLRLVGQAREARLAATILLPRDEVIVRTLSLPGVADKDAAGAIQLQIDTLHPWGDVEVAWGWSRVGPGDFVIGLVRKEQLDAYEALFAEAGIPIAAATFSAAVIHPALRVWSAAPASLLCITTDDVGHTELYGESASRALFSAEFSVVRERAIALARAELRLASDYPALTLNDVLPSPVSAGPQALPLAYTAGIAGAAQRVARFANLLPPERRASHNRLQYLGPVILVCVLAIALLGVFVVFPAIAQKRYRDDLDNAARKLEPAALRAQALERRTNSAHDKIALLDEFRRRPQADLDVLNELTRLLPPPVWTNSVEIYPDSVVISGEAEQAAPLLKILDSSPLFQNSEFSLSVTRTAQTEQFRIKTMRRGRTGRNTP